LTPARLEEMEDPTGGTPRRLPFLLAESKCPERKSTGKIFKSNML